VKKLTFMTVVAAVAAVLVVVSVAMAVTSVPFTAKYSGNAVTQATDNVVAITANGKGTGTLLGIGKITGVGTADSSVRPCVPFTGTGKMSGVGGTVIFKVIPQSGGCGDDSGQLFSITGKATVVKATGKLAKAKGTLKMTGTYDRSSGAFSVKFKGALTK
jgi:hypothetical protein